MSVRILEGDCRAVLPTLPAASVQCVVTSPPYWGLRDYGVAGQLGLEPTPEAYVAAMVGVFREVRRVLRDDGTLWLNMGDCYANMGNERPNMLRKSGPVADDDGYGDGRAVRLTPQPYKEMPPGLKPKDLVGVPWRLAFALQADGWYLRADIIWAKPNPMPESVTDRPTKAHEYVFLLSKQSRYFYDADAVREPNSEWSERALTSSWTRRTRNACPDRNDGNGHGNDGAGAAYASKVNAAGRNLRSVWTINPEPFPDAHFATFPTALAARCIRAGTSERGACGACGAPWARLVVATGSTIGTGGWHDHRDDLGQGQRKNVANGVDLSYRRATTGWQPSCACAAPVVPCTVLDPFGGSGTVGEVAEGLGRDSILVELSSTYVAMARQRTAQLGLFSSRPGAAARL